MKKFYWVEGWDEKGDDVGRGILNGRDTYRELKQVRLRCVGLLLLSDDLKIGLRYAVGERV